MVTRREERASILTTNSSRSFASVTLPGRLYSIRVEQKNSSNHSDDGTYNRNDNDNDKNNDNVED